MAEGGWQDDVVCRYFLFSSCRDGDRCLFSHDRARRTPDTVCRYYLQGRCLFGPNCRYDHVSVNEKNSSKPQSQYDRHPAGLSVRSANQGVVFSCTRSDTINLHRIIIPTFGYRNEASNTNVRNSTSFDTCPHFAAMHTGTYTVNVNTVSVDSKKLPSTELCQRFMTGECARNQYCPYIHGDICDLCKKPCLLPNDEKQRKTHIERCKEELELSSTAIQRGMDKTCGICLDVVLEKEPASERKFGILEKCNHVYCLTCIKKWRKSRRINGGVTKTCPQCRTPSDFVTPSDYFVETGEEKEQLIVKYKKVLSLKDCRYFKKGRGSCPFGGECFYLHCKPDGTKVELPPPTHRRQIRDLGHILDELHIDDDSLDDLIDLDDINNYDLEEEDEELYAGMYDHYFGDYDDFDSDHEYIFPDIHY